MDTLPPTILSITPVNGATKLTPSTDTIVITFSEPMNKASAQAAYVPGSGGTAATFSWNATSTELTIDPKLAYPSATDPAASAEPFKFSVTTAAKDLAGNPLAASVNWQFTLLREITQTFGYSGGGQTGPTAYALGSFVGAGDIATDFERRGFLSFDISALPDMIQTIESATINTKINSIGGNPFGLFGNLLIQSVSYTTVNQAAFDAPPLHDLGTLIAATGTNAPGDAVSKDVLVALKDDYANRATRNNRTQFKLLFPSAPSVNSTSDEVFLGNSAATDMLAVEYLYP